MSRGKRMHNRHRQQRKDYTNKKCSPLKGRPMSFEEIHRGCMDKKRFHSRKTVRAAAKDLGLRYYRCGFCGEFHLTKSKGSIDPWKE